ncbi:flavin reductase family protein [Pseudomonas sp. Hz4]
MNYTITDCRMLSASIKEITVSPQTPGCAAPEAGAHFKWFIPELNEWRHYSAVQLADCMTPQDSVVFAIRLTADSVSSRCIRSLTVNDTVQLDGPFNTFTYPLTEGVGRDIAIAGGIGITPLTGILHHLTSLNRSTHLHYFARSDDDAAYALPMQALLQERLHLHFSSQPDGRRSIGQVLADLAPQDRLYVCGPQSMLNDVFYHAEANGLARERIHFEIFNVVREVDASAFVIDAVESGISVNVNQDQTLLEALEAAGLDPLYDCRRGECGVCALEVLEGEVDHRDFIMSEKEAACSARIYPCVSRAKSQRLKLAI